MIDEGVFICPRCQADLREEGFCQTVTFKEWVEYFYDETTGTFVVDSPNRLPVTEPTFNCLACDEPLPVERYETLSSLLRTKDSR